jgi:hypothetical protein
MTKHFVYIVDIIVNSLHFITFYIQTKLLKKIKIIIIMIRDANILVYWLTKHTKSIAEL